MVAGGLSLAEPLLDPRLGSNARLDAISAAIDWALLAVRLTRLGR
jgi:hypothetical protein